MWVKHIYKIYKKHWLVPILSFAIKCGQQITTRYGGEMGQTEHTLRWKQFPWTVNECYWQHILNLTGHNLKYLVHACQLVTDVHDSWQPNQQNVVREVVKTRAISLFLDLNKTISTDSVSSSTQSGIVRTNSLYVIMLVIRLFY